MDVAEEKGVTRIMTMMISMTVLVTAAVVVLFA
jgi:hypothetical protein